MGKGSTPHHYIRMDGRTEANRQWPASSSQIHSKCSTTNISLSAQRRLALWRMAKRLTDWPAEENGMRPMMELLVVMGPADGSAHWKSAQRGVIENLCACCNKISTLQKKAYYLLRGKGQPWRLAPVSKGWLAVWSDDGMRIQHIRESNFALSLGWGNIS